MLKIDWVDNPTSSTTTIVINDCCSLAFSQDAEDGDSSQDCAQYTELVQDKDADDTPLSPLKTTTHTSATDNVPTDIAAGPDQAPAQPKMKFPATLKGNKHRSFRADWYKRYRWLEYSRERNAAYCYPCRLFTTEPGKPLQELDLVTGNMRWERMELFHVMVTAKPTCKPWFPGKNI